MTRERTLTIKLVVMLSLNTYRKVKTTGLIVIDGFCEECEYEEAVHTVREYSVEITGVNQEIVIIMDGQWCVSSVGKAMSSSGVKATARRKDYVTVCKYMRQEVAQQI